MSNLSVFQNQSEGAGVPPRPEYPRPQFERAEWLNLNGEWEFAFDDERRGDRERWYDSGAGAFDRRITVPFAFQSRLSGIGDPGFHDLVWYRRGFDAPSDWTDKRVVLHIGACDYASTVWVNGRWAASHEGGHTPFHADVTDLLNADGGNEIVVRAEDFSRDVTLPRGKQFWKEGSESIFYTRTTGIWQTVWLEPVAEAHIAKVKFTPDIDRNEVRMRVFFSREAVNAGRAAGTKTAAAEEAVTAVVRIRFDGELIAEERFPVLNAEESRAIGLSDFNDHGLGRWWTPEKPSLYDAELELVRGGETVDAVSSYFGMRKISIEDGRINLNNRPYYMRLVLDQGYFPDGVLTAPTDEDLVRDIKLTKEMGFDGVRKHQKMEDPRFLYWCDKMGLLVWGEAANAYAYSEEYVRSFTREWQEAVDRDYNHPCIVVWVPMNESWGIPNVQIDKRQQDHGLTLYHLTRSLDDSRPVIYNDGWEMMRTDIVAVHDYEWREDVLNERYATPEKATSGVPGNRRIFVGGSGYEGQPILVTEFGGIAYKKTEQEGWGYSGAENDEDFLERLGAVIRPMTVSGVVQGFCYTQLTDVEQEINGLVTYDRTPKVPLEEIRKVVRGGR
ncbi:glycoside hydrolase family 2 TIM barrel-domain containing protein [Saccharibacillus sp. CPCC 101409]|uniref:glycoside hydrolase family 2 protein n=1 Tax=Saccharibacillus sp. CPCC 101409 TaxID=3058041 RepID=UPI00267354A6|nr:sugar-binding domain-containing protein [Saccharibacillus sp. CPCC 101409]MDO3410001.1 glycoside hydrolase family 2 TIM barrel-domain containing protein [Saccharibacillus sp. CPCC 101409]